jgi:predicted ribosomally synthesized peptide with nif11-like leader
MVASAKEVEVDMSSEAVESFYEKVLQDPGLQEQFKAAPSEDAFVRMAVNLGSQNGYSFTPDEVRSRISQATGGSESELTDRQLEIVAGGAVCSGAVLTAYGPGTPRTAGGTK